MSTSDHLEINALMARYFDGLYHCDTATLRTVFHEQLCYANANSREQECLRLEAYMSRIERRTSPATRNEARVASIDAIELKAETMGIVKARAIMWDREYTDLLTLIRTEDGWRILSKVFTFVEIED